MLSLNPADCLAQKVEKPMFLVETHTGVDTLSIADRLSVRTNAIDWTLLVPNIGVEFLVKPYNWGRWSAGFNVRFRPKTPHTFNPGVVYNMTEARIEVRNYYRPRLVDAEYPRHKRFIDRIMSVRRSSIKHPTTVFYRGLYASYGGYSFKFGSTGHQGKAFSVGATYGMVKPLYVFGDGTSLDFDLSISAGLAVTKTDEFTHDRESNCYPVKKLGKWSPVPFPVVNEARVGFVYRFGSYPLGKRYRWRYDVDVPYHNYINDLRDSLEVVRRDRETAERMAAEICKDYNAVYDSVAKANAAALKLKAAAAAKAAQEAKTRAADSIKAAKNKVDSTAIKVDSTAIKADTVTVNKENNSAETDKPAETDSTTVQSAEPESTSAESESTVTESENTATEQENEQQAEPESTPTESENTATEQENEQQTEPESTPTEPENTATEPESEPQTEPESTPTEQENTATEPESEPQAEPESTATEPESTAGEEQGKEAANEE